MNPKIPTALHQTRRTFLKNGGVSLGSLALSGLMGERASAAEAIPSPISPSASQNPLAVKPPMFPAKAKSVIFLHMSGAPPQQELFDWKPKLVELHMQPCPQAMLEKARFAFIKGHPKLLGSPHKFAQHGKSGAWVSELLPNLAKCVDDIAFLKGVHTEQFNHAPAELLLYTGSARNGGAAMGSWITYGLGSVNQNLPGFVVMISGGTDPTGGKALWSTGFLPSVYQGVQCRSIGEPVLYANNPKGMAQDDRRASLDALKTLNQLDLKEFGDPETITRIEQYELAYRMQMAVPEAMNIAKEDAKTLEAYGATPGGASLANNCLLARRLVERGVRYVQLYDWGWDIHGTGAGDDIVTALPAKCKQMDKPVAALLTDLKRRGLFDETLVIWGGEFGRTSMNEARGGSKFLGRDHHPHAYTMWMAGAGIKGGVTFGSTDELGYHITDGATSTQDIQATIQHLVGLDPWKHRYAYQGLQQRLIGPEGKAVIRKEILA